MTDLIRRRDAVKAVHDEYDECLNVDEEGHWIADDVENLLDDIPVIEAIPISWIYEYFADDKREMDRLEKLHGGPCTDEALADKGYCRIASYLAIVKAMIETWRKVAREWENG